MLLEIQCVSFLMMLPDLRIGSVRACLENVQPETKRNYAKSLKLWLIAC